MRLNKLMIFGIFLSVSVFTFMGCRKKKDTSAEITVRTSNGTAVANAQVVLFPIPTTTPSQQIDDSKVVDTAYTNLEGVATFHFNDVYQLGQAGVVVLNIRAKSGNDVGEGIIKIEEEVKNQETVYL